MPVAQYLGTFKNYQDNLVKSHVSQKGKKPWIVALIAMYFVEFIHAMKLSQHQLKNFEAPVTVVYESFVKPSIQNYNPLNVEETILPAFQIHSALASAFFPIYIAKFEASELEGLASIYSKVFKEHVKADTMVSRFVIINTVKYTSIHLKRDVVLIVIR